MKTLKQKVNVDVQVNALEYWKGDLQNLPPNKVYELVIDYPLSTPAVVKIKTGKDGMGAVKLLSEIGKAYLKIYKTEDAWEGKSSEDDEDEPPYGIWGHDIGDLVVEAIYVDHKKKRITLGMGS